MTWLLSPARYGDTVPRSGTPSAGVLYLDFRPESRSDRPVPDSAPRFWNDPECSRGGFERWS
ncbi:hypothetical protein GS506_27440 [Rhodococcus hoagii]|nr:hypothetical protein [Prescottella equi]